MLDQQSIKDSCFTYFFITFVFPGREIQFSSYTGVFSLYFEKLETTLLKEI